MPGLARALLQAGRLTAQQADTLVKKATSEKHRLADVLLQRGNMDGRTLASFCSETFAARYSISRSGLTFAP